MKKQEINRTPIEAYNYDFDREYPFSDFLKEIQKDVKRLEKKGFKYVWLMPELPFYGHPEETIRYRLFGMNPDKRVKLKEQGRPVEKNLKKNPGKKNNEDGTI